MTINRRRGLARWIATAGSLCCLLLAFISAQAYAHAALSDSEPADGAVLERAPAFIVLRFNEEVTPLALRLISASNGATSLAITATPSTELRAALPTELAQGSYAISWRVTSADAHPISGTVLFSIGAPTHALPHITQTDPTDNAWRWAAIGNRLIGDLAVLFVIGTTLFSVLVLRGRIPPSLPLTHTIIVAAGIGVLSNVAAIVIAGGWIIDAPATDIFTDTTWRAGWNSNVATRALVIVGGLGLLLIGFRLARHAAASALFIAGSVVSAAGFALSGHVASLAPSWPAQLAMSIHVLTAAFWLGAFWPLAHVVRRLPICEAAPLVRRFSAGAIAAVGALVIAGTYIALTRIHSPDMLIDTAYGRVLLTKLGVVVLMLFIAMWNRYRLLPKFSADASASLHRNLYLDMALVTAVLALTAVLGHTHPESGPTPSSATHAPTDNSATVENRGYRLTLHLSPARVGTNRLVATITDNAGQSLMQKEVTATLSLPSANIHGIERQLTSVTPGAYVIDNLSIPAAGHWQVTVAVLLSDFEQVTFETHIAVER